MTALLSNDRYWLPTYPVRNGMEDMVIPLTELNNNWGSRVGQYPIVFSINLQTELLNLFSSVPPSVTVEVGDIIDFACYIYDDLESHFSPIDEFLDATDINTLRTTLSSATYDVTEASKLTDEVLEVFNSGLIAFIRIITGILQKTCAPSVVNYGSVYRFDTADHFGNVFFRIRNAQDITNELENMKW